MNKLLLAIATVAAVSSANAMQLKIHLGMPQGAMNIGATFLAADDNATGWGGYAHIQSEKESNNVVIVDKYTTFGALYQIAVLNNNTHLVYVSPGFGVLQAEDGAGDNQTAFGPSMKIGAAWKINDQMSLGLEHAEFVNWSTDKLGAGGDLDTAYFAFNF